MPNFSLAYTESFLLYSLEQTKHVTLISQACMVFSQALQLVNPNQSNKSGQLQPNQALIKFGIEKTPQTILSLNCFKNVTFHFPNLKGPTKLFYKSIILLSRDNHIHLHIFTKILHWFDQRTCINKLKLSPAKLSRFNLGLVLI